MMHASSLSFGHVIWARHLYTGGGLCGAQGILVWQWKKREYLMEAVSLLLGSSFFLPSTGASRWSEKMSPQSGGRVPEPPSADKQLGPPRNPKGGVATSPAQGEQRPKYVVFSNSKRYVWVV